MSLKRLGELKEILLGFDHEPDHVLRSVMKNGAQSQGDISSMNEPPEKLAKIAEPAIKPMLSLDEVESMLKNEHGLTQDVIEEEIFPAILQYKKGIKLCPVVMHFVNEDILVHKLILPWMEIFEPNELGKEIIDLLSSSSQKAILQSLIESQLKPDWSLLLSLKKVDLQDSQVQKCLAGIIVKQGPNKDLGLGRHMLALIKSLPRSLDANIHDSWSQAASMHQSFLSKMCINELNKISSVE